jgi:hypothetical protein
MLASLALLTLAAAEPNQPMQPPPPKPQLICRESETELGSHIRTGRRCKTAEEWREEDSRKGLIPPSLTVVPNRGDGAIPPPPRPPL